MTHTRDGWVYNSLTGDLWTPFGCLVRAIDSGGYLSAWVHGKTDRAHKLIIWIVTGEFPPKGKQVDHINKVKTDNRWLNLRIVSSRENNLNKEQSVKARHVYRNKKLKSWFANMCVNGKTHNGPQRKTYEEALCDATAMKTVLWSPRDHVIVAGVQTPAAPTTTVTPFASRVVSTPQGMPPPKTPPPQLHAFRL